MQVDKHVLSAIEDHLTMLRSKFDSIFPAEKVTPSWIQNLFLVNTNDVEENFQEEILDLKASGTANMMLTASNLTEFWLSQTEVVLTFHQITLNHLMPFATTYLYEKGFSTLMHIKTKERNRLKSADNRTRVFFSNIAPRFELLKTFRCNKVTKHCLTVAVCTV